MKKKLKLMEINNGNNDQSNKKDTSPIIPQRSKIKFDLHIIDRFNLSQNQIDFIELVLDKNTKMVFVEGPAGTSKSFLSIYCALKLLNEKRISDIIYARSAVECSEKSVGYLPGTLDEKISVYLQPLVDKLEELLPKNEIDLLKKDSRILGIPIGFLRGLNFNAKCVIADETQNMTIKELTTISTRIGEYSKLILLGDSEQSDINGRSGFVKFMNIFDDEESRQNGIRVFKFTEEDIVRSSLVRFIVKKLRKQN